MIGSILSDYSIRHFVTRGNKADFYDSDETKCRIVAYSGCVRMAEIHKVPKCAKALPQVDFPIHDASVRISADSFTTIKCDRSYPWLAFFLPLRKARLQIPESHPKLIPNSLRVVNFASSTPSCSTFWRSSVTLFT